MISANPSLQQLIFIRNRFDIVFVFLLSVGLSLFVLSLFNVSFYTNLEVFKGYWVLSLGWLGLLFFQLAWLSNPLNLIAVLLVHRKPVTSFILSSFAFIVATQTFLLFELPTGFNQEKIYIKEFGIGAYFWYSANILFLVAIFAKLLGNLKLNNRNRN